MAQHERKQSEWPVVKRERVADFLHPDGYLRSDRSVAGPLRLGTEPRVGPKGLVQGSGPSDYEMDRVTPRGFDPMGTSDTRAPAQENATLLSRQIRGRAKPATEK
jgi:hypothetical protein